MTVKLWNDGDYTHKEDFRGETIIIPAKSFIEMDGELAHIFCSQFFPPAKDADGNLIEIARDNQGNPMIGHGGFKKLRIEHPQVEKPVSRDQVLQMSLKCQSCGFQAASKWELDGHIADVHAEVMIDNDAREELLKKRRGRPKGDLANVQSAED